MPCLNPGAPTWTETPPTLLGTTARITRVTMTVQVFGTTPTSPRAPCAAPAGGVPRRFRRRPLRLRRRPPRRSGTSPSREAATTQQAARQHSPTPCRAPRPPERRTTKRTALPSGSTGTRTAAAALYSPVGFWVATRPARLRPKTSTGTGTATPGRSTSPTTRPRPHRASPRGVQPAAAHLLQTRTRT